MLAGYKWKRSHRYVSAYWLGTYELPIQECLARELKQGHIFYDVGANAGFFSLFASMCVTEAGHVFAFEPLQENIQIIYDQLQLNQVTNCTLVESAVSDCCGNAEFYKGSDTSTAHIKTSQNESEKSTIVKTITLDEFTKSHPAPDLIKMDIEGAEIQALKGSRKLLSSAKPPAFLIELHSPDIAKEVYMIFKKMDYLFCNLKLQKVEFNCIPTHVLALSAHRDLTK
jgi:FkbM family methyltransferase